MTQKILGWIAVLSGIGACVSLGVMAIQNSSVDRVESWEVLPPSKREAPPSMERVGAIEVNTNTVYLWAFDFEGRRCLWATVHYARGGVGGLTCWEEMP